MSKHHLGDGTYASHEGDSLVLTANDGIRDTNRIVLEPEVWFELLRYAEGPARDSIRDEIASAMERWGLPKAAANAVRMGLAEHQPPLTPEEIAHGQRVAEKIAEKRPHPQRSDDDRETDFKPDWSKYPNLSELFESNASYDCGGDFRALLRDARADAVQFIRDVKAEELSRVRKKTIEAAVNAIGPLVTTAPLHDQYQRGISEAQEAVRALALWIDHRTLLK